MPESIQDSQVLLVTGGCAKMPVMEDFTFQYQHRVVYAECTVGTHVYYARYLDMLEAARG